MKKKIIIIFAIIIFALLFLFVSKSLKKFNFPELGENNKHFSGKRNSGKFTNTKLPSCGLKKDFFGVSPVKYSDILGIVPLGFIGSAPEHIYPTDHIYFHLQRKPGDMSVYEVPIYSPGDFTITDIKETKFSKPEVGTDYDIYFKPCEEVTAFFFHVSTVSDKIKAHIKEPFDYCGQEDLGRFSQYVCEKRVNIEIKEGELIGTVGQLSWQFSFDMGLFDTRMPQIKYANPDRWRVKRSGVEYKKYITCPLDYFTKDVKDRLKAELGDGYELKRTIEPVCGTIDQDIAGTTQGTWFPKKQILGFERPELSLMHDFIEPNIGAFAVGFGGDSAGLPTDIYNFAPKTSGMVNLDFGLVKDNKIYCYEDFTREGKDDPIPDKIILVQLVNINTLRIEGQTGSTCGDGPYSFSSKAIEYIR